MTIEQANAAQAVLRALLQHPISANTEHHAALLADKSHKALMAGLTGADVRRLAARRRVVERQNGGAAR